MNYVKKIFYTFCCLTIFCSCQKSPSDQPKATKKTPLNTPSEIIHKAHLDNGWYSQSKEQLQKELYDNLALAGKLFSCNIVGQDVRALIVPHAGHHYSGLCAASAYQTLLNPDTTLPLEQRKNTTIKRVIILAPSHTHFFTGIALPNYTTYQTVLGSLTVDPKSIAILQKNNLYKEFPDAHHKEHSIEVQLPFLQSTIAEFTIVPLVVGHLKDASDIDALCQRLERIIDNQTLVVISSDFIHHGASYEYAPFSTHIIPQVRSYDSMAVNTIMQQSYYLFTNFLTQTNASICGKEPIKLLLALLGKKSFKQELTGYLTGYYTSPQLQAASSRWPLKHQLLFANVDDAQATSSVSYVGMVFASNPVDTLTPSSPFTGYEQQALLMLAHSTLENNFLPAPQQLPAHLLYPIITQSLQQPVGAFVTLTTKNGDLRGCIGNITTDQPLYKTAQAMAYAAAFQDSRFTPLTKEELDNVTIDITVLSQPRKIESYKDIVIGTQGIILHKYNPQGQEIGSALFLPQVAREHGWDIETTLDALSHKAGLDYDAWQENCSFEVFDGFEIKEAK